MQKLLLIDGLNILRRCYEANPSPESEDKAKAAVQSALQSMKRGIREHAPTHFLTVFDACATNWRHTLYPAYKEHRTPMSPLLATELEAMKAWMTKARWAWMARAGEEADDTIGGVSEFALAQGAEVVLLSTDKDLVSLVALGVKVYNHFGREWRDIEWCLNKFGVNPEQLTDHLALTGDSVDNIPGVAGIGAKTAAKLLAEYRHLEAVLAAAEAGHVKGKTGANLLAQKDQARLSFELASMRTTLTSADLRWPELEAPSG